MLLQQIQGSEGGHVGHQSHVDFRNRAMGEDGLATRSGVTRDQSLDVDGRLRDQPELGVGERFVAVPLLQPEQPLEVGFVLSGDRRLENLTVRRRQRLDPVEETGHRRRVPILLDERVERLHQMPHRAVDRGRVARVDVLTRSSAPLLAGRDQLQLDDALGPQVHLDRAIGGLTAQRNDDPQALPEGCFDVRLEGDLLEAGRADLLFALADQHDVDRWFPARGLECVQRGEEGGLGSLGVGRAPAHDHLAEPGLVHQASLERGRGPLGGIVLLHVVHEVHGERVPGAAVEGGEHAGLSRGRHQLYPREAGVPGELGHVLRALGVPLVLGRDRGFRDPVTQDLQGRVMLLRDLCDDQGLVLGLAGDTLGRTEGERSRADRSPFDERSTIEILRHVSSPW